jgi:cytidine deaminase
MRNDQLISKAQSVLNRKTINGRLHGDVGAALIGEKGDVYTGVCADTSGWGLCAERSAIAAMITAGGAESKLSSQSGRKTRRSIPMANYMSCLLADIAVNLCWTSMKIILKLMSSWAEIRQ